MEDTKEDWGREKSNFYDIRKAPHLRGLKLQQELARLTYQASMEETAAILTECPDILERIDKLEKGEIRLIPIEDAYAVAGKRLG